MFKFAPVIVIFLLCLGEFLLRLRDLPSDRIRIFSDAFGRAGGKLLKRGLLLLVRGIHRLGEQVHVFFLKAFQLVVKLDSYSLNRTGISVHILSEKFRSLCAAPQALVKRGLKFRKPSAVCVLKFPEAAVNRILKSCLRILIFKPESRDRVLQNRCSLLIFRLDCTQPRIIGILELINPVPVVFGHSVDLIRVHHVHAVKLFGAVILKRRNRILNFQLEFIHPRLARILKSAHRLFIFSGDVTVFGIELCPKVLDARAVVGGYSLERLGVHRDKLLIIRIEFLGQRVKIIRIAQTDGIHLLVVFRADFPEILIKAGGNSGDYTVVLVRDGIKQL